MAKTKALISCAVTAQLICVFVFAYANCWFSHAKAHYNPKPFLAMPIVLFLFYFYLKHNYVRNVGDIFWDINHVLYNVIGHDLPNKSKNIITKRYYMIILTFIYVPTVVKLPNGYTPRYFLNSTFSNPNLAILSCFAVQGPAVVQN